MTSLRRFPSIATFGPVALASLWLLGCGHGPGQPAEQPPSSKQQQPAQRPVATAVPTTAAPIGEPVPPPSEPDKPAEQAQPLHRIESISLALTAPSPDWKRKDADAKPGVEQIGFERKPVFAADGEGVVPYCAVIVEPVEPDMTDAVQYSLSWRLRMPFEVDAVFSHEDGVLQLKNAVGYWGRTKYKGDEHTLLVVHGLLPGHGVVIVCDATTSVIDQVRGEFDAFLKSMRTVE